MEANHGPSNSLSSFEGESGKKMLTYSQRKGYYKDVINKGDCVSKLAYLRKSSGL